jgi:hypothetical protein
MSTGAPFHKNLDPTRTAEQERGGGIEGLEVGVDIQVKQGVQGTFTMAITTMASKTRTTSTSPRALPFSPTARQGHSPIGRSEDSSGTSTAPEGTRGAYLWGWRTC